MFNSILVPVDFSEGATHALRLAIRVARVHAGSITLLHVGPVTGVAPVDTADIPVPPTLSELYEQMAQDHRHSLERLAREEIPDDVPWRVIVRDGYPPDEIVSEVTSGVYDVVVMATHGRTGLARAVLGSVTERVLRALTVPVLVTR